MEGVIKIVYSAIQSIIEFLIILNVYVMMDIMIMELLYVRHVIILGNFPLHYYFHLFSLTCDGDTENNCLSCDNAKNRELVLNKCICEIAYYELIPYE